PRSLWSCGGRWTNCADDREAADSRRAGLAARPLANPAAELPLQPELLGLCNHRPFPLWRAARELAGIPPSLSLPPLGGIRPRSCALKSGLRGKISEQRQSQHDPG